jgi:hypothetical protein
VVVVAAAVVVVVMVVVMVMAAAAVVVAAVITVATTMVCYCDQLNVARLLSPALLSLTLTLPLLPSLTPSPPNNPLVSSQDASRP